MLAGHHLCSCKICKTRWKKRRGRGSRTGSEEYRAPSELEEEGAVLETPPLPLPHALRLVAHLSVGVGTCQISYTFIWAEICLEPDGYEFTLPTYDYECWVFVQDKPAHVRGKRKSRAVRWVRLLCVVWCQHCVCGWTSLGSPVGMQGPPPAFLWREELSVYSCTYRRYCASFRRRS